MIKKPVKEESPATSIGNASIEQIPMTDRRYNPKKPPVLLKRFSKYIEKKKK
jgi:hypothetical protein